jgi:hypothetical protein
MSSHVHVNSENRKTNKVFRKVALRIKPKGVVLDDDPHPLLGAITDWIKETIGPSWMPDWVVHREARAKSQIDQFVKGKDFVLLDNRLQGKFQGFHSGFDIGRHIADRYSDLQIFFYTAYPRDLEKPGHPGTLKDEVQEFINKPNVMFFTKGELEPNKRLDELCYRISIVSDNLQASISGDEAKELQTLLGAQVARVKNFRYRIADYDRRNTRQRLRCLSDPSIGEIEVPTDHLIKAGISRRERDVVLKILEFDGGQILSFLAPAPMSPNDLADEVIEFLKGENR